MPAVRFQHFFIPQPIPAIPFRHYSIPRPMPAFRFQYCAIPRDAVHVFPMETPIPSSPKPLDRTAVMQAIADPLRWAILGALAPGTPLSVQEIAGKTRRDADLVSKHLRVLRECGAVEAQRDASNDTRRQLYAVPERFRSSAPSIDFGFCVLRFI
jgi:DNA-binding transcriptional ArsR family regulator